MIDITGPAIPSKWVDDATDFAGAMAEVLDGWDDVAKARSANFATHTLLTPAECDCDQEGGCPICDGGLAYCKVCRGGESELDESCESRCMKRSLSVTGPAIPPATDSRYPDDAASLPVTEAEIILIVPVEVES